MLGAARARAEVAPERIALVYTAPADCPDADAFFAGIHARANAVRAEHGDRTFRVSVTSDAAVVRGELEVAAADGTTTTREVSGATCAETVTALALVAALAIEERAVREVPRPPAAAPAWQVAAGAGIARYSRIMPASVFGISAFGAARHDHLRLRIGFATTQRAEVSVADFRWTIGRAEVCPFAWTAGRFEAAPCGGFEAGVLDGRGTQVAMPTSDARPWLAPDATLRLALRFGRAALELEGLVAAPLVRDRFVIVPTTTIHQVPAVTAGASASLAVDLW